MSESAEERRARRARTWQGGVAHSFDEADQADLEFWLAATPQERVRAVTELVRELDWEAEGGGPSDRLQRAVGGVRARGR